MLLWFIFPCFVVLSNYSIDLHVSAIVYHIHDKYAVVIQIYVINYTVSWDLGSVIKIIAEGLKKVICLKKQQCSHAVVQIRSVNITGITKRKKRLRLIM